MEDSVARIISLASGEVVRQLQHDSHVLSVCLGPGDLLATGCADKSARVFAKDSDEPWVIAHGEAVASVCFSLDGALLATGAHDDRARIIDVASRTLLHELVHQRPVFCV